MVKKSSTPFLGQLLKKIAPRIGARVLVEPQWGYVGQITFKNGRRRYFRATSIDLNSLGASAISKDKDYANFFMAPMGYPTIQGKTFFSPAFSGTLHSKRNMQAGYQYARKLGFLS